MIHIPLLRAGQPYKSLDVSPIPHFRTGAAVAEVSQANRGLIAKDLIQTRKNKHILSELPVEQLLEKMGSTLVVTAIIQDRDFIRDLFAAPNVDRLKIGPIPTMQISWDQLHEGNLFEHLYRQRSLQITKDFAF